MYNTIDVDCTLIDRRDSLAVLAQRWVNVREGVGAGVRCTVWVRLRLRLSSMVRVILRIGFVLVLRLGLVLGLWLVVRIRVTIPLGDIRFSMA